MTALSVGATPYRACRTPLCWTPLGQIYLKDNPLLREPLAPEHIKPRLLGHWGTTPGLTFVWAHLNRVIVRDDLEALYITGPGHGGPGVVATAWLEGTYSEQYAHVPADAEGMQEPRHCAVPSIRSLCVTSKRTIGETPYTAHGCKS